jgi:aerobic carbon-monoxide dehydrogenase large subunit
VPHIAAGSGRLVGQPVRRREDREILRGRARFLDDLDPPGLAHAAFVRSPLAHARIGGIRFPESADGLIAVVGAADLEGRARPLPVQSVEGATLAPAPHPLLASGEVRYVGQPVVAVVAESRALAEDAAELVDVDYEPLEAVVDPRRAGEALMSWRRAAGGVEGAFAAAERVVTTRHSLPRLVAAPIENRGALASHDADGDLLTIWVSAQDSHRQLHALARVLGRSEESIRVVVPRVGGAFGSKGALAPETAVVALAALQIGRPVKWAEDRLENFLAAYQGRGVEADVELALADDGSMLALRARIYADLGAYLHPITAVPPHTTAMLMTGCYAIPAVDVEVFGARTNKVPTGPYRGAGRPEAASFLERTVDAAARELRIDPLELRRRNLIREFPHTTPLGWTYDSGDYEHCLERAVELVEPEHRSDAERLVGTGVGMYVERAGGLWESARAELRPSGRLVVKSGSSPHGQGHATTFAQIAAERLGVPQEDVELRFGDSAVVPPGVGTFASRSVAMGGSALLLAVDEITEKLRRVAARLLEVPAEEVDRHEHGFAAGDGRSVSFRDVAREAHGLEAEVRFSSDLVFASGAYAAVVEIERATGRLRVLRIGAVDDPGTIVNPLLAEGQVIGGAAQGLGECLVEEAVHDEGGELLTASFADYSLLTAAEMPPILTAFVQTPSPLNPLGAKGIGEGGAIGTPAAVANAVADALAGAAVDPPFTEEKLWRELSVGGRS